MPRLRVYMLPDYRSHNPYQQLLSDALAGHGVDVTFPSGYRLGLPVSRGFSSDIGRSNEAVLHLHWPEAYLTGTTAGVRSLRALRLWFDVAVARRAGEGFVWTLHNHEPHERDATGPTPRLYRRLARLADALIVHGEDAHAHAVNHLGANPEHLAVIPQAHYREVYGSPRPRAEACRRLDLDSGHRIFLFVGMVRPYKGLLRLIDAWGAANLTDATLVIAGLALDTEYAAQLRARVANVAAVRLDEQFVPDSQMADYLSAATVCVFPFERISNSGSLQLALGYGLPVVAPALPAVTEAVGTQYPLLYEPCNTEALTKALLRASQMSLSDPDYEQRARPLTWTWDEVAEATAHVYRNLRGS